MCTVLSKALRCNRSESDSELLKTPHDLKEIPKHQVPLEQDQRGGEEDGF